MMIKGIYRNTYNGTVYCDSADGSSSVYGSALDIYEVMGKGIGSRYPF